MTLWDETTYFLRDSQSRSDCWSTYEARSCAVLLEDFAWTAGDYDCQLAQSVLSGCCSDANCYDIVHFQMEHETEPKLQDHGGYSLVDLVDELTEFSQTLCSYDTDQCTGCEQNIFSPCGYYYQSICDDEVEVPAALALVALILALFVQLFGLKEVWSKGMAHKEFVDARSAECEIIFEGKWDEAGAIFGAALGAGRAASSAADMTIKVTIKLIDMVFSAFGMPLDLGTLTGYTGRLSRAQPLRLNT
ncbi:hypothetical protein CYMTET_12082 [Cymbomonas tetramitiformis]|uniref:Uncharacterized protein n=1 Tax=Cymbomonas tetramitiformis TaxID=36881 RepID=A0AAE0GKR9_9CHLO|nr:hypothetical protein CYMTET_12082 [Cymbomonas tetramitiformis]